VVSAADTPYQTQPTGKPWDPRGSRACCVSGPPVKRPRRGRFSLGVARARGWRVMVVVMKPGASQAQVDHVIERIEQLGLRSHVIVGTELTVVAALGEKRDGARQALETIEGVDKVVPILAPYKMASTEVKREPTVVQARGLKVGDGHLGVIAGPCSV